jgi:hypothetical protein
MSVWHSLFNIVYSCYMLLRTMAVESGVLLLWADSAGLFTGLPHVVHGKCNTKHYTLLRGRLLLILMLLTVLTFEFLEFLRIVENVVALILVLLIAIDVHAKLSALTLIVWLAVMKFYFWRDYTPHMEFEDEFACDFFQTLYMMSGLLLVIDHV